MLKPEEIIQSISVQCDGLQSPLNNDDEQKMYSHFLKATVKLKRLTVEEISKWKIRPKSVWTRTEVQRLQQNISKAIVQMKKLELYTRRRV